VSHIRGRFSVDVQFTDSTSAASVQAVKSISLQHATEYDFGKVAVVTGTVGTVVTSVSIAPTTYRNSAGDIVSLASVSRFAFSASGPNLVRCIAGGGEAVVLSRAKQIAVSEDQGVVDFDINVLGTAGTSAYTLVMYGS